jgi:ATP-dependent Clp protease ATP-binding subunit ClpC
MYERFTDRARKVMQLANQEAQRFNHEYIGTEHVLLGLVKEGSGVAANVLKNLDIDLRKVRLEVEQSIRPGPQGEQVVMGRLPHTPHAKRVIEFAIEEARGLNHNYVGTEHVMLGLLRESEGCAWDVLTNLGLKLDDARGGVRALLGHSHTEPAAEPLVVGPVPPTDAQLRLIAERIEQVREYADGQFAGNDPTLAARCRAEGEALTALLAWYEHTRKRA